MAYPAFATKANRTHNVETVRDSFKFAVGAAGAVGTLSQASGGFVTSVTRAGAGDYTVQLAKPYPASIVRCDVSTGVVAANSATHRAAYKAGSYSATAGTFTIYNSDHTPAAADPVNGSEIMVDLVFLEV